MLHLIKLHTYPQEAMYVYGSFDSQFAHLISNIDRSENVLAETDMIYVNNLRSKRERTPAETDIYVNILRSKRERTPQMIS